MNNTNLNRIDFLNLHLIDGNGSQRPENLLEHSRAWFLAADPALVRQALRSAPLLERMAVVCFLARECNPSGIWAQLQGRIGEDPALADALCLVPFLQGRATRPSDLLRDDAAPLGRALVQMMKESARELGQKDERLLDTDQLGPTDDLLHEGGLRLLRTGSGLPPSARRIANCALYEEFRRMGRKEWITMEREAALIRQLEVPEAYMQSFEMSHMSDFHLNGALTVSHVDSFALAGSLSPTHSLSRSRGAFDVSQLSICTESSGFISPNPSPVNRAPDGTDDSSDAFHISLFPVGQAKPKDGER